MVKRSFAIDRFVDGTSRGNRHWPVLPLPRPRRHRNLAASITGHAVRRESSANPVKGLCVMSTMQETRSSAASQAGVSAFWSRVADRIAAAFSAAVREIRVRRAMRELSGMGEGMLRDVGLTRDDVERAVRYGRS
jgi:uncharacterized protein YjiS (DUF1127 family)